MDLNIKQLETVKRSLKNEIKRLVNEKDIRDMQQIVVIVEEEIRQSKVGGIDYNKVMHLFNAKCKKPIPSLQSLTDERKRKIRLRFAEFKKVAEISPMEFAATLFDEVSKTPFLNGVNSNGWVASFDWLFKNEINWRKVAEGNYANKDLNNRDINISDAINRAKNLINGNS